AVGPVAPRRGEIYWAGVPKPDGQDLRHRVVIVSRNAINRRMKVIAADVTSREHERKIPTAVPVEPTDENGLTEPCYVICHDLTTLRRGRLDSEPLVVFRPMTYGGSRRA